MKRFWAPGLAAAGYELTFAPKSGETSSEEIAVLSRRSRFEVIRSRAARLNLLRVPPPLAPYLAEHPTTAAAVAALPTVAQLVLLRDRSADRLLLVANTHLYFANPAVHARLIQAVALLEEVQAELRLCRDERAPGGGGACERAAGFEPGVLLAGDLNSDSTDAVLQLLLEGRVAASHRDWRLGALHWSPSLGLAAEAKVIIII